MVGRLGTCSLIYRKANCSAAFGSVYHLFAVALGDKVAQTKAANMMSNMGDMFPVYTQFSKSSVFSRLTICLYVDVRPLFEKYPCRCGDRKGADSVIKNVPPDRSATVMQICLVTHGCERYKSSVLQTRRQ